MAYLFLLVVLLAGCVGSSQLPDRNDAVAQSPSTLTYPLGKNNRLRLPRGEYYVTFHANLNTIQYFSLDGATARYVGTARIDVPDCLTGYYGTYITFDQQSRIDVFPHCKSGAGVLQLPLGVLGNIKPLREVITRFPSTATVTGDVDAKGNLAVGYGFNAGATTSSSDILVYGPSASGRAKPLYSIPVFTRNCFNNDWGKGPGKDPGSPAQIAFDGEGNLVTQIGPMQAAKCGYEYIERFAPGATRYSSWLLAGLLPGNKYHHQIIWFTPGAFAIAPSGQITFGAYVGKLGKGRAGGITYDSRASGNQPLPSRIFTDAGNSFASQQQSTIAIGIDRRGDAFIQNQIAGGILVEFPPNGEGPIQPINSWQLPAGAVNYPGTFVEIR